MDSSDSLWNSNCNSSSNNSGSSSSSSNNNNNNNNSSKSNKDRGGTRKGRRSPSDSCYLGGVGADLETSPQHHQFYATNNNDYSKYDSHQLPSASSEYNHYSPSGSGDYTPPYDAGYSEGYGGDCRYSVNGDYPHPHQSNYQEYSDCDNSRCCSDHQGGYGNCSPSGYSDCDSYGHCNRTEYSPSPVQVTAKVLFGSVSAISNLKQKKSTKKK